MRLPQRQDLVRSVLLFGALALVIIPFITHFDAGRLSRGFGDYASTFESNSLGSLILYEEPVRSQVRDAVRKRLQQFDLRESTRAAFFKEWDRVAHVQRDVDGDVYFCRPQFKWRRYTFSNGLHYTEEGLAGELNRAVEEAALQALPR